MTISFGTSAISTFGTLITSIFILLKAISLNLSTYKKMLSVLWCLIWASFYAFYLQDIHLLIFRTFFCAATIFFAWKLLKMKLDTIVSAFLLSYGISNVLYFVAAIPIGLMFGSILSEGVAGIDIINFNEPIYLFSYILVASLQLFIACLLFKIRRFKQGFPFLQGKYAVVVTLIVAGVILTFVSLVVAQRENHGTFQIFLSILAGVLIVGAGVFIWIRRGIKAYYKKWLKTHNDELHRQEMEAKDSEIRNYKEMHETVRAANHSIRHRQAALERRVTGILEKMKSLEVSAEFSEELTVALDDIRRLAQEYQEKVDSVKVIKSLPSTNIQMIDDLFCLYSERFANDGIDFKLKVNGSVIHMTESVIERGKLETMIGDHLQDALIAVKAASDSSNRSVLAVIGEAGEYYEFSVHDSGIPFEADTLVRLGTERITTHADEGGSGIGFMTTFETMRECGASLIIKEYVPGGAFSKCVTIRFDGKNQYIIKTYRDFPESDRYTVIGT